MKISTWPWRDLLVTLAISRTWFSKWTLHVQSWLTHVGCLCNNVRHGSYQSIFEYMHIWTIRSLLGICRDRGGFFVCCEFILVEGYHSVHITSSNEDTCIRAASESGWTHWHILVHVRNERASRNLTSGNNCCNTSCWNMCEIYTNTPGFSFLSWKPWHLGIYGSGGAFYRWGCSTNYLRFKNVCWNSTSGLSNSWWAR